MTRWKTFVSYAVVILLVLPFAVYSAGPFISSYDAFAVTSGSMGAEIPRGSLIYTVPSSAGSIDRGDVITYRSGDGQFTTHRVVEKIEENGSYAFRTKGDANENVDPGLVSEDDVVGKVVFSVPLAGDIVSFARSSVGSLLMVILPALAIASIELKNIFREAASDG